MPKTSAKTTFKNIQVGINTSETPLTPYILVKNGWERRTENDKVYYIQPYMKDRDRVYIEFESHYYRVWHSHRKTFISVQTHVEWLLLYLLLQNPNREFKEPIDILKPQYYAITAIRRK
jgi:hypothetical protein